LEREYFNIKELTEYLNISKQTIYKLIKEKKIPFHQINNGKFLFNKNEIIKWIESK
jgi:excisionase family DNA binding protein